MVGRYLDDMFVLFILLHISGYEYIVSNLYECTLHIESS
jgi:hypothetical protein